MTSKGLRLRRILAVTDDSYAQVALRSAVALAEAHGAALEVLACVEPPNDMGIIARLTRSDRQTLTKHLLDQKRATIRARLKDMFPDRQIEPHIALGKPFLEIIRKVSETDSDLVVKAADPLSGASRFLYASTDQHLLRKCPCAVWLQMPAAPVTPRRVLAAVDLDSEDVAEPETLTALNRQVVDVARGIARGPEAQVIVLHAWDAVGEGVVWAFTSGMDARLSSDRYVKEVLKSRRQAMNRFIASVEDPNRPGPPLLPKLIRGAPEQVIEAQSRTLHADLVVMGTVARTGVSGVFIGNTAENIINSLGCPVLAVKPDGYVSPVLLN
ncbi:universal stress protein [Roseobacter sinensis]|uniref:Universal stress protein n=1 Tax=Roseobacter sinensis TaxID=2931391 RepID=A0ABT3BF62_9RHOB|nr:universal stress protein [Roseobacter sp. WL0113]MCV3272019.1 universal stress protein [Roseobacter sp. WL0113]